MARFAADLVLVAHATFILFAVLGGLLVLRDRRWAFAHLPALAWGIGIELAHGLCPLTVLENSLREQAGAAAYRGDFLDHYLRAVIYPGVTPASQLTLALLLAAINLAIYARVVRASGRSALLTGTGTPR